MSLTGAGALGDAVAPVNKIIPFSLVDGPGSRVAIFLQGCNIRCAYCHNPETQALCVNCGACVKTCPVGALSLVGGRVAWDSDACVNCDTCIRTCEHLSSPKIHYMSAREVFEVARGHMPFVRGITTSGGECMLREDFLRELFSLCAEAGLGRLIDSNGTVDFSEHEELLALADGVMLDLKAWEDSWFCSLTGTDGRTVRKNVTYLAERGKLEELRVIVTEGFNDAEAAVEGAAGLLGARTGDVRLRLMRFRPFGVRGAMAHAATPGDERMDALEARAHKLGFGRVVVS